MKITRLAPFALFDLKGPSNALEDWAKDLRSLPKAPNSLVRHKGALVCHTGQNRWILRADLDQEAAWVERLRPSEAPPEISIVLISDTMTFFRVIGPDALSVMSIGCPLDLHPSAFGTDAVSFTEFFGLRALVLRSTDGFDVAVEQSFGDMIADYFARATA